MPYPRPNWREEQRWNAELLTAMKLVVEADRIFSMSSAKWDKVENEFYVWMLEGITDGNTV